MYFNRENIPFTPANPYSSNIETFLSSARFGRYLGLAHNDRSLAFRLYRWNMQLCETFYIPMGYLEVGFRNTIARALTHYIGSDDWAVNPMRHTFLPYHTRDIINNAKNKVSSNGHFSSDRVIAELTFGFWTHLVNARYRCNLWGTGQFPENLLHSFFSNMPLNMNLENLRNEIRKIKDFRNRIAHLEPIFPVRPGPQSMNAKINKIISWMDQDVADYVNQLQDISLVINKRPR